jgi:hypothetical protein
LYVITPPITQSKLNNSYTHKKFDIITTDDLKAFIKLKNGSSPGFDEISSDILKKLNKILCKPL